MSEDKLFARVGKTLSPGTMLFRDGEPGEAMYVIKDGRVRIFKEVRGEEKTLAYLGPGEFFGEMALLNGKPRTASAEVVETTRLFAVDAKAFGLMIRNNGEIAVRLIKRMAHRLDSANALVTVLMQRDPRARVILGLARAVEYDGERAADGSAVIATDAERLAQQTGVSVADVGAVVRRLYRLGIVDGAHEGLSIPNPARLEEFLGFLRAGEGSVPA
jgi:CRP/FNR family transcriptional regulator, cyclic AMP receptor protein